jgi:hypothetical protein
MIKAKLGSDGRDEPENTLSATCYGSRSPLARVKAVREREVRFPWSHNNDPDSFQPLNVLDLMNHTAVPSW